MWKRTYSMWRASPLNVAHNAAGRDGLLHPGSASRAVRFVEAHGALREALDMVFRKNGI
jgi:hypothetical protein